MTIDNMPVSALFYITLDLSESSGMRSGFIRLKGIFE